MASALALARVGWQAQVCERASAFAEVGAGVQLGPNVTRVLHAWGLQTALQTVAAFPHQLQARSALRGEVLATLPLGAAMQARYGAPYVTLHRADLHQLLHEGALAQGVQVLTDCEVESLHMGEQHVQAQVRRATQHAMHEADLAVIADGVWSQLRQRLLDDGAVQPTGHLAYRALLRQSDLPAKLRSNDVTVWMGTDVHVVHYPVRGGEWLNLVVLTEGQMTDVSADALHSWNAQQTAAQTEHALQAALRGTCAPLQELVRAGTAWRVWPLCGRGTMQGAGQHAQGRVAVVGDAAHPMLPYLAQGAGMAIEDAAALCQHLTREGAVPSQLQAFASQRWQRNAQVQRAAQRNGQVFHASGLTRWGRDVALRLAGPLLMDQAWLYDHQVVG